MPEYKPVITHLNAVRHENDYGMTNDYTLLPRNCYSLAYILYGGADFISDAGTVTVGADDIIFVPLGARYISRWHGAPKSSFLTCYFDVRPFCEPFGNKKFEIQKILGLDKFRADFERIVNGELDALRALAVLYDLCAEASERLEYTNITVADERINAAAEYIRENSAEKITVCELAHIANMSASHFQRCFKKEFGVSPIEYKNEIMISNAARMLLDNRAMPIESVSLANGFDSAIYFRRLFKKRTGKTPGEYRRSMSGSV